MKRTKIKTKRGPRGPYKKHKKATLAEVTGVKEVVEPPPLLRYVRNIQLAQVKNMVFSKMAKVELRKLPLGDGLVFPKKHIGVIRSLIKPYHDKKHGKGFITGIYNKRENTCAVKRVQ